MAIVIGIDLGTTTITALAVDLPAGRVAAWHTAESPRPSPEQAEDFIAAGVGALRELTAELSRRVTDVAGIGITGQQHGVVLVNHRQRPQTPFIGWQDRTGDQPCDGGEEETWVARARRLLGPDAFRRTGCRLAAGYGAVSLLRLNSLGLAPTKATACLLMDLFGARLTGETPTTEPTCAASTGAFDILRNEWDEEVISALGLPRGWFPPVRAAGEQLGGLTGEHADFTGLPEGLPVFAGIGDNQASFLGTVADPASSVLVNVGTGGQVSAYSPTFAVEDMIEARPFPGGGYLLVSAGQCGGSSVAALARFIEEFAIRITERLPPEGRSFDLLVRLAGQASASCVGLRCEPYFDGTRLDPTRTASFTGVTAANFTPENMARSVLEGMARVFAGGAERLRALRGDAATLVGAGNGIRRNPVLARCLADAFGMPLHVSSHREEAAFGAALSAGVGLGLLPGFLAAGQCVRYDEAFEPSTRSPE